MSNDVSPSPDQTRLGRDFWLFQTGQMISIVGDACGAIAVAWWILEATQSAARISAVLAPALVVQTILTPLLGPLGDRLSRKRLIASADLLRGGMMACLAFLAFQGVFSIPLILAAYIPFAAGSALFTSSNLSIVPQLVPAPALQRAVRLTESLQAVGRVVGGIVAGALVSWMGIGPALMIDALSFGVACLATMAIVEPRRQTADIEAGEPPAAPQPFTAELRGGFQIVHRVPVLFWLCVAIGFFNFALSPVQVLLPAYAKLSKGMPAWFLGGLESSMGLGIIVGAMTIGAIERIRQRLPGVIIGLVLMGTAIALLPHLPGIVAPLLMMVLLGVGAAWTNIPVGTRVVVAVPDRFRSRVNSILAFVFDGTAPIGVAVAGVLVSAVGVSQSMTWLGIAILAGLPALLRIPRFLEFFRRSPAQLDDYFLKTYPQAFERREQVTSPPRLP